MVMTNIHSAMALTVDVEDYFQVAAFDGCVSPADWEQFPQRAAENTRRLLDLFDQHGAKATFFVLGWIAERNPDLVREIDARGHEVASHGYCHAKADTMTAEAFYQDVLKAKLLLESIIHKPVIGYRAPSFSIGKQNEWAFAKLKEAGYHYSSSTYPVVHDHYGTPDWPQAPYVRSEGIWEIPMPVLNRWGMQVPIAGGGYFRLLPYWLSRYFIRSFVSQAAHSYMFYFHPWEIDASQPRIEAAPARSKFRHYVNLQRMEGKIAALLADFTWRPLRDVYPKVGQS
jgi:polysaccharide deacetylase family protein (PEP-CTERM system associated)